MPSFLSQLRAARSGVRDPLWKVLREGQSDLAKAAGDPLREALAGIVGYTFANGATRISTREIHRRLGIPPALKLSASKRIAGTMRSLGWSQCRMGRNGAREWGWMKRDYDIEYRPTDPSSYRSLLTP